MLMQPSHWEENSLHSSNSLFFNGWGDMSSHLYELRQEPMIMYKYIWVEKEKKNKPRAINLIQSTQRQFMESSSRYPHSLSDLHNDEFRKSEFVFFLWPFTQHLPPPHKKNSCLKAITVSLVNALLLLLAFSQRGTLRQKKYNFF